MTNKIQYLAADYTQSDLTRRMDLYLEYPELRTIFLQIEETIHVTEGPAKKLPGAAKFSHPSADQNQVWSNLINIWRLYREQGVSNMFRRILNR